MKEKIYLLLCVGFMISPPVSLEIRILGGEKIGVVDLDPSEGHGNPDHDHQISSKLSSACREYLAKRNEHKILALKQQQMVYRSQAQKISNAGQDPQNISLHELKITEKYNAKWFVPWAPRDGVTQEDLVQKVKEILQDKSSTEQISIGAQVIVAVVPVTEPNLSGGIFDAILAVQNGTIRGFIYDNQEKYMNIDPLQLKADKAGIYEFDRIFGNPSRFARDNSASTSATNIIQSIQYIKEPSLSNLSKIGQEIFLALNKDDTDESFEKSFFLRNMSHFVENTRNRRDYSFETTDHNEFITFLDYALERFQDNRSAAMVETTCSETTQLSVKSHFDDEGNVYLHLAMPDYIPQVDDDLRIYTNVYDAFLWDIQPKFDQNNARRLASMRREERRQRKAALDRATQLLKTILDDLGIE